MNRGSDSDDELALARAAGVLEGEHPRAASGAGAVSVAVVGATGVVGREMLRVLEERRFPFGSLRAFASERSKGRRLDFGGTQIVVDTLRQGCFEGVDLVLMEVESPISREWAPVAVKEGATVVDNSSAWRRQDEVPLVVSEVNPEDLEGHQGIIANPNCTTMILMPALGPLHRAFGAERLVITSLQSVSGSGQAGLAELEAQARDFSQRPSALRRSGVEGGFAGGVVYPRPIGFNVLPQCGDFTDGAETTEEEKLAVESRKILHAPGLKVGATCVRVPVAVGHSLAVTAEFKRPVHVEEALDVLADSPGLELAGGRDYATPLEIAGTDPCVVGRVRPDWSREGAISFWVSGDNLRKGAALNCVQLAEVMLQEGWLKRRH